jgi:putative transposase
MTAYRRYRVKGGCYFFTVALAERRGNLLTENLKGLRAAFREVKQVHPFEMEAIVILPDHLHCIWTLAEGDDDFSTRSNRDSLYSLIYSKFTGWVLTR